MDGIVDTRIRPLAECTEADVVDYHAFVYGRVKIWTKNLTDNSGHEFHWSKTCWWKAMWYPHRGPPTNQFAWGVYGGGSTMFTGAGDAEITHFMRTPPIPSAKQQGE